MTDTNAPSPRAFNRTRVLITLAVAVLAVAIASWVLLGNGASAKECPVQKQAALDIDFASVGELAGLAPTGEGRGYATLAFNDEAGKAMDIGDFRGRGLLVNFWASWCVPCREEMPALDALAAKYNSDDFMVLPINLDIGEDGLGKAKAFLEDNKFAHLPLYADNTFKAFDRLKQEAVTVGLPASLILDANGCELAVLQGPAHWNTPDGYAVIDALVKLVKG